MNIELLLLHITYSKTNKQVTSHIYLFISILCIDLQAACATYTVGQTWSGMSKGIRSTNICLSSLIVLFKDAVNC